MAQDTLRETTIPQALAMLVVNPMAAFRVLGTGKLSSVGLAVAAGEEAAFDSFLSTHGSAFRVSVLLLRKRRMDNILDTLPVVRKLFSEYEVACYWDDYLSSLAVGESTPQNPLLESVYFGKFIQRQLPDSDIHAVLVSYDVARNEVLAAIAAQTTVYLHASTHAGSTRWAPLLHPSVRVQTFPSNVGALVRMLTAGGERNSVVGTSNNQPESILFFKNWTRGGVGSLRVNAAVEKVLPLLNGKYSADYLISQSAALQNLLNVLDNSGAIAHVIVGSVRNEA